MSQHNHTPTPGGSATAGRADDFVGLDDFLPALAAGASDGGAPREPDAGQAEVAVATGPVAVEERRGEANGGRAEGANPAPDKRRAGPVGEEEGALRESAAALTPERLLRRRRRVPESGWRLTVYRLTGGLVNVGDSADVRQRQDLEARVAARLTGSTRSVAVLSRKGGVGKTTTATLLGKTMGSLRHDRTVAIDANPDAGTLILRTERQTPATVWDVVRSCDSVGSFADMSRLVSRDTTRLDVIASESDPHRARAFGAAEYRSVAELLSRYYSIAVTDTGTDFTHEVLGAVLGRADCVVVVAGTKVDEARTASETIDLVEALGYCDLAARAIVALVDSDGAQIDVDEVHRHFEGKTAAVVQVPRDRHIAEGSLIDLDRLHRFTRRAALTLAAAVVDQIKDSDRTPDHL
jgi:MinD-like ATPase involved in chromosome partitioning or flagellar assembly